MLVNLNSTFAIHKIPKYVANEEHLSGHGQKRRVKQVLMEIYQAIETEPAYLHIRLINSTTSRILMI